MDPICEDKILDLWIREWTASQQSSLPIQEKPVSVDQGHWGEMDTATAEEIRQNFRERLRPFDDSTILVPGEIRLLSSKLICGEQQVYVAVLDTEEDPLIVPFSPFHVPATPYELAVDFGVLGIWQGARIDRQILAKTWRVQAFRLSDSEVQDAQELLEAYRQYKRPAPKFEGRIGARLSRYSLDPRQEYMRVGEIVLASLNAEPVPRHVEVVVDFPGWPQADLEPMSLAADTSRSRCLTAEFRVSSKAASIQFSFDPIGKTPIKWNVFDAAGNFSDSLKGFSLLDAEHGEILCRIDAASGELRSMPPRCLALLDPSGEAIEWSPSDGG